MRLAVTYTTSKIPNEYRMMIVSLIKKALSNYNEELFKELYFYDGDKKNKKTKDFTFSVYIKDFKREGEEILTDEITVNFSIADTLLAIHLYNALVKLNNFTFNNKYELNRKSIKKLKNNTINSDYAILKTSSPIVIKDKDGKFLDLDSKDYLDSLNYITNISLCNLRGYGLKAPIEFIPISMKKVVVKERIEGFTKVTSKDYIYINSFKGVFALKGDTEDLNDIYKLGLGYRRNQGFGMLDLA